MAETTRRDDAPAPAGPADATAQARPAGAAADPDATVVLPRVGTDAGRDAGRDAGEDAGEAAAAPGHGPGDPDGRTLAPTVEDDGDDSPLAVFPAHEHRRRWPRVLLTVLGVLIVLVGGYGGAAWALGDRVPRGTTVAGVAIGGLTGPDAVAALEDGLADASGEPIPVAANGRTAAVDPDAAGLTLDAEATVDALTGVDLAPTRLWHHVVGGAETDPVTRVDDAALADALDGIAGTLGTDPVDATVVFADGAAHATDAAEGSLVDTEAAADVLREGWLTAARPVELPTETVEPDITQEEGEAALTEVAEPFADAPVVVAVGGRSVELPVDVLTSHASFEARESDLELTVDGERLVEEVLARTPDLLTPAADARYEFGPDGVPFLVPATPGTSLDADALADAVIAAGTGDDRTARVELVESDPEQSTERMAALGITEIVSEFSTPLTNEPIRTENLRVGASKINGTLVRPDETFSLTEALGPITREAGFRDATVIVNGEHVQGTGGGLSQISTTTFNAAFLAGFEDVEHQPHSEWFARYPEGRESTLYTGVIDMKFKNTTPYGALLQAWVGDGRVHVRIWGTKYWTVETSTSPRSGVVQPTTVHSSSPTCTPQSAGNPGFSVTVTRRLLLDGEEKERTSDTWRYKPQNRIICDPPAPPDPPAAPAP